MGRYLGNAGRHKDIDNYKLKEKPNYGFGKILSYPDVNKGEYIVGIIIPEVNIRLPTNQVCLCYSVEDMNVLYERMNTGMGSLIEWFKLPSSYMMGDMTLADWLTKEEANISAVSKFGTTHNRPPRKIYSDTIGYSRPDFFQKSLINPGASENSEHFSSVNISSNALGESIQTTIQNLLNPDCKLSNIQFLGIVIEIPLATPMSEVKNHADLLRSVGIHIEIRFESKIYSVTFQAELGIKNETLESLAAKLCSLKENQTILTQEESRPGLWK